MQFKKKQKKKTRNKNNFHVNGSLPWAISNSSSKGPNILPVYKQKYLKTCED